MGLQLQTGWFAAFLFTSWISKLSHSSFLLFVDLQVGQVSAMSDMDLFELLSGQSAMNLTEQDEQVLDLLIAEGDDMLPM